MTIHINEDQLKKLYARHGSLNAVAKHLDTDSNTIKRKMVKFGLEFKKKNINTHNDNFFSKNDEGSFYWAGFIAADGCVKENKQLTIALSNKDKSHLFLFKNSIETTANIYDYDYKYAISKINICSKQICEDLKRFNIIPRKTHKYLFPQWVIKHPLVHHFMRGYFDGDGCASICKKTQKRFTVRGTEKFLFRYKDILIKQCGFPDKKIYKSGNGFQLDFQGNKCVKLIYEFLYNDAFLFLNRKRNILK